MSEFKSWHHAMDQRWTRVGVAYVGLLRELAAEALVESIDDVPALWIDPDLGPQVPAEWPVERLPVVALACEARQGDLRLPATFWVHASSDDVGCAQLIQALTILLPSQLLAPFDGRLVLRLGVAEKTRWHTSWPIRIPPPAERDPPVGVPAPDTSEGTVEALVIGLLRGFVGEPE